MAQTHVTFNAAKLAEVANLGLRRAMAFLALGERAWLADEVHSLKLDVPLAFQMMPDPLPKEAVDEVRNEFRVWLTGSALAEIMQGLALFADDLYSYGVFLPYHGKNIDQEVINKAKRFKGDTNIASKLKEIENQCGLSAPLLQYVDGWARARNAHARNRGIVRERDFTPSTGKLTVTWRQLEVVINGNVIESIIGHKVDKGSMLGLRFGVGKKEVSLGSSVDLGLQEMAHICLTAHLAVSEMAMEMQAKAMEHVRK